MDALEASVVLCPCRFISVDASRRFGKTAKIAAPILAMEAINVEGSFSCYTAPNITQLDECFRELTEGENSHLCEPYIAKVRTRPNRIWWKNGSRTEFRSSGNARGIKGRGYGLVVADEGQEIKGDAFIRAVFPTISDKRDAAGNFVGRMIVLGQPRGEDWRFRTFVEPARNPEHPFYDPKTYAYFNFPAPTAWAFRGEKGRKELEQLRFLVGEAIFEEDYMCSLVADSGAAFNPKYLANIIKGKAVNAPRIQSEGRNRGLFYGYLLSSDLGRMEDPSFNIVFEFSGRNDDGIIDHIAVVYAREVPRGTPHQVQASNLRDLSHRYNNCMTIIDATGGAGGNKHEVDDVLRWYRREIPESTLKEFIWHDKNKRPIMESMAFGMERGTWSVPAEFTNLIQQIRDFRKLKTSGGHWQFMGKDNTHDDGVHACAVGLHWINRGFAFAPQGGYKGAI